MEKGFGFIGCDESHEKYGRDVFLHKADIGDLTVGTEVTFAIELNKQGMPQARDLATSQGMVSVPQAKRKGGGKGGGKGGNGKSPKGKGKSGNGEGGKGGRGKGKDKSSVEPVEATAAAP